MGIPAAIKSVKMSPAGIMSAVKNNVVQTIYVVKNPVLKRTSVVLHFQKHVVKNLNLVAFHNAKDLAVLDILE